MTKDSLPSPDLIETTSLPHEGLERKAQSAPVASVSACCSTLALAPGDRVEVSQRDLPKWRGTVKLLNPLANRVVQILPDVPFTVAGRTHCRTALMSQCRRLGLDQVVGAVEATPEQGGGE